MHNLSARRVTRAKGTIRRGFAIVNERSLPSLDFIWYYSCLMDKAVGWPDDRLTSFFFFFFSECRQSGKCPNVAAATALLALPGSARAGSVREVPNGGIL